MNTLQPQAELLTTEAAAAVLGVRPQTLALWRSVNRYDLAYLKIGRLVKYRRADLEAFLERSRVETAIA